MKNFKRQCPKCGEILYHTSDSNCKSAEKAKRLCRSCSSKEISSRQDYKENHKTFLDKFCKEGVGVGESNPFWGKHHSDASKIKIANGDKTYAKTKEFKIKMSSVTSGHLNPMYGRSFYDIWVEKFGKEEADRRETTRRQKMSLAMSGPKNAMYGKPSPNGSGNGWSGWYKGWFFRSIKELSYVVLVLEKNCKTWVPFEKLGIKIPYQSWDGKEKTYTPDFIVDNHMVVEIKPKRLISSPLVVLKSKAAIEFCKLMGWEYIFVDPPLLNNEQIKQLRDDKEIVFTKRYEQLFIKNYVKDISLSDPS